MTDHIAYGDDHATHQKADGDHPTLHTNQGMPVSDNQNQLKANARGPVLLEDHVYREKMNHFDHERIPERIVHARGTGAHGYFENYEDLSDITSADIFARAGEKTPVFARFSTVAGGAGSVDTPRDVRGFAVKFYTKQGNWDLVGNNIPVFFIQDAIKFPDLIHAAKMEADRGFPQAATAHDTFWDFMSLMPEATHMVMWIMSDRTLPRSLAMMEGFGIHTFRLVNAAGKSTFVKFHWKPKYGLQSTIWDETVKIAGADPDYHRRDFFERIGRGDFPEWELGFQLFDEDFANAQPYDVLDATKIIPEEVLPIRKVGRMVLDRYPDNFFAETEQVAFCPSHVVPGIDHSNDPLLQGRLFSYLDTQLSRLGGVNFAEIPINRPKNLDGGCPFMNQQRDGHMQMGVPKGRANYEPNSLAKADEPAGYRESDDGFKSFPAEENGTKLRIRPESFADHFSQARLFFRSMADEEQAHMASALVFELSKVSLGHIRTAMLANLRNVDETLAQRVADGLEHRPPRCIEGRGARDRHGCIPRASDHRQYEGHARRANRRYPDRRRYRRRRGRKTEGRDHPGRCGPDGDRAEGRRCQMFEGIDDPRRRTARRHPVGHGRCDRARPDGGRRDRDDEGRRGGPVRDGRVRPLQGDRRIRRRQGAARQGGGGAR